MELWILFCKIILWILWATDLNCHIFLTTVRFMLTNNGIVAKSVFLQKKLLNTQKRKPFGFDLKQVFYRLVFVNEYLAWCLDDGTAYNVRLGSLEIVYGISVRPGGNGEGAPLTVSVLLQLLRRRSQVLNTEKTFLSIYYFIFPFILFYFILFSLLFYYLALLFLFSAEKCNSSRLVYAKFFSGW